jgi:hypothetical protein
MINPDGHEVMLLTVKESPGGSYAQEEPTAFGAAPPHPELKRLEPLLGNWKAEDQTLDGVLGPGVRPGCSRQKYRGVPLA